MSNGLERLYRRVNDADSRLLYLLQIVGFSLVWPLVPFMLGFLATAWSFAQGGGIHPVLAEYVSLFGVQMRSPTATFAVIGAIYLAASSFVVGASLAPVYWIDRSPALEMDARERNTLVALGAASLVASLLFEVPGLLGDSAILLFYVGPAVSLTFLLDIGIRIAAQLSLPDGLPRYSP